MQDNIITKVGQTISVTCTKDEIKQQIASILDGYERIYSYLIYAKYKDKILIGWLVEYTFSQYDKYNTLQVCDIIDTIVDTLLNNKDTVKSVIGYKQPSFELMLQLYKPLIHKLAVEQCNRWTELEYEDAVSICQLTMLKLYKKGYYIHKHLLRRSFENEILMSLRHSRSKPEMMSLEQEVSWKKSEEDDALTIASMIPDYEEELRVERAQDKAAFDAVFAEIKDILVDMLGERQFQQLLRDYGNRHTTSWSRRTMKRIKNKFKKVGFTIDILRWYL